jgi:hypothetical protein
VPTTATGRSGLARYQLRPMLACAVATMGHESKGTSRNPRAAGHEGKQVIVASVGFASGLQQPDRQAHRPCVLWFIKPCPSNHTKTHQTPLVKHLSVRLPTGQSTPTYLELGESDVLRVAPLHAVWLCKSSVHLFHLALRLHQCLLLVLKCQSALAPGGHYSSHCADGLIPGNS